MSGSLVWHAIGARNRHDNVINERRRPFINRCAAYPAEPGRLSYTGSLPRSFRRAIPPWPTQLCRQLIMAKSMHLMLAEMDVLSCGFAQSRRGSDPLWLWSRGDSGFHSLQTTWALEQ